jgi:hypothetical protein
MTTAKVTALATALPPSPHAATTAPPSAAPAMLPRRIAVWLAPAYAGSCSVGTSWREIVAADGW